MTKATRVYKIDVDTQIVVRDGDDKKYRHFGVLTDEISGHFTLTADNGNALEKALSKIVKPAKRT